MLRTLGEMRGYDCRSFKPVMNPLGTNFFHKNLATTPLHTVGKTMTGKSLTELAKVITLIPQTGEARHKPSAASNFEAPLSKSVDEKLDHRFSSWISTMALTTGVASGVTQLVGGAEAFLEMFGPISS